MRQQDDTSIVCRSQIERADAAADEVNTMRDACRADAKRLCAGVPSEAGPLVECLQANRDNLSETCRSIDPEKVLASAEVVDAINSLKSKERAQEAQQVLQSIESIAFTRSQVLFQVDSYEGVGGRANVDRLLFNPQVVFGPRRQFSVQLKVPVLAVYPYRPDVPAATGVGATTTGVAWAFQDSTHVHQYLSAALQWTSPDQPPVGSAWAVIPSYALSILPARWLSATAQVAWLRSFASSGYPEFDLLVFEPIVVVSLPGRAFLSLDFKLAKNFVDDAWLPVIKGLAGLYLDRKKSVSISGWYQTLLTKNAGPTADPGTLSFNFGVGAALAYFFDW
jgi:hypothetical protein